MAELDVSFMEVDEKAYDKAVDKIRQALGSYHFISNALFAQTGVHVSYNTVRNWFVRKDIPIQYAAMFQDLTDGEVKVTDFYPWLRLYL